MYTLQELDALRFYGGDTRERGINGHLAVSNSNDTFWKDENAYRTLNTLLFPGIDNEKERIMLENNKLNKAFIENIETTIKVYCDVYNVICKSASKNKEVITKRVERFQAIEYLLEGHTISFTSTSQGKFNNEFANKNGIVLLEFHIPGNSPYADLQKILKAEYKFCEEKEILLPPFIPISIIETELLSNEMRIMDMHKKPPKAKYLINILESNTITYENKVSADKKECLKEFIVDKDNCAMASRTIECMNEGHWNEDFIDYIEWKGCLQKYIKILFKEIRKDFI